VEQDEYRKHYLIERDHWWFQGMRGVYGALLQRVLPHSQERGVLRILDLGCGAGGTSQWLRQFGHVTSLDASWDALDWAGRRALPDRVQGLAEQLPFRSEAFDLVTGFGLIEHIEADTTALREMARVCRRGGWLMLLTSAYQFLWSHHDRANHHQRRYTARQLDRVLRSACWEPRYMSYVNTALFPAICIVRAFQRLVGWDNRQITSDLIMPPPPLNTLCRRLLLAEAWWLQRGALPFGVSLVCVARRAIDV